MRLTISVFLVFLFHNLLYSQTAVYRPRNLEKAYTNGTRASDGRPGPNYWQNRARYVIDASLEPKTRRLSGKETITYLNNSPDTLKMIRFKLIHDVYRKGSLRGSDINPIDITDEGVRIDAITYNGAPVAGKDLGRQNTFLDLRLPRSPLPPRSSATLTVEWSYRLPVADNAARECVCDSTSFFVPYWYPQIAVYDDVAGWASAPYTGLQEFYHDFSDYEVSITLPRGFMLWATGEWQNAQELLSPAYFDRWQAARKNSTVTSIFTAEDLKKGDVFKSKKQQIFRYRATDVPDFAFGASDHYNWDASSVVVDPTSGRQTWVSAAYHPNSKDYYRVAQIAADGIRLMSSWLPGYPYPWPSMTVFNGNDAMEYPMMVNDVSVGDGDPTSLTLHEVSHTYFPFMMGINEQDYAWMDEGWAAFFDYLLTDSMTNHQRGNVRDYPAAAGTDSDVPPMVRARFLTSPAYRIASYNRPQAAYFTLLDLLGYETFHRCMVEYMDTWKGKHPIPYDFFATWNRVSGQNLDWFWRAWFYEWGYPDLALAGLTRDEAADADVVMIERRGSLPVPVFLEITYTDDSRETLHQTAAVWRDGKTQLPLRLSSGKKVKKLELGRKTVPDTDKSNNVY